MATDVEIEKEAEVEVAVAEAYELPFVARSPKRKALDIEKK